ncbi:MAG: hypothetical protein ABI594_14810 [Ginsengibacter sp.]
MKRIVTLLLLFPFFANSQTGAFTFTLSNSARTSAGVFKKDSTLVRTLWADKKYSAGTYTEYWDGKDDYGVKIAAPDANYDIKVLSSNVNYSWEGIIGNTSLADTGSSVHRGYYTSMTGMAITGTTAYFCQGYSEGYSSEAKFSTLNPQVRLNVYPGKVSTMNADYVATDGINVYWAGYDAYRLTNSFVHVTRVSDDGEVTFGANGVKYTMQQIGYPKTYNSTIDYLAVNKSKPSGLAVQTSGSYLFVSHKGLNELHVLNKTTGALVRKLIITSPAGLATDGNYLWVVSGTNTVAKYLVNANGTLGSAVRTLTGIATPGAIQAYGSTLAVIDAGVNQVVRFFNTTTGVQGTQLGTTGGYANSPDVTNTRFFFNDYRGNLNSFIAWQPNGTFWLGDPGNFRELHFDATKKYLETIMSLGTSYSTDVDKNNINRVFAEYLEFAIDYTKPLTGNTGWQLTKNWGYYTTTGYDKTKKLQNHITLSNGRTYAFIFAPTTIPEIVELTSTGLKFSGIHPRPNSVICKDGSLQLTTGSSSLGSFLVITKYSPIGFDVAGVPLWSKTGTLLATTPLTILKDPIRPPITEVLTASKKVIFYNPDLYYQGISSQKFDGYHLGAIKVGDNTWRWKTQRSTPATYQGAFPGADYFETGNGVSQSAGSRVNVVGNNIITGYNGEGWKNVQTNYYNHYYEDGLPIAQFGTDRYFNWSTSAAGSAGNELTPAVVADANGDLYLYHGDESQHGGMHRWKITNLNSIKEQYVSIPYAKSYVPPATAYTDLHAGLPAYSLLLNSNGWTKSGILTTITGTKKYVNDGSPDVYTTFAQLIGTATVQRDLGTNNVSTSWKISGLLSYEFSDMLAGSGVTAYLDVLDAAGKIISRFYYTLSHSSKVITINANSAVMASGLNLIPTLTSYQPFEVNIVNGMVTFSYANYGPVVTTIFDPTAKWQQPKTLRQYFVGGFPAYIKTMGIMDMHFYKDYTLTGGAPSYITTNIENNKRDYNRGIITSQGTYE